MNEMQSVFLLTPLTEGAKGWVAQNVQYEPYQRLGRGIAIDHHYIGDIVVGLIEDGWLPNKDFQVS